jgi:hypothetical protein
MKKTGRRIKPSDSPVTAAQLETAMSNVIHKMGNMHCNILTLFKKEAAEVVAKELEAFYVRRKNVSIDKEVNKQLKDVLLTAVSRIDGSAPKPST